MEEKILYKTLVIGVIVLFVGVGVQTAIAKPDIIDVKPKQMNKDELRAKIDEILEKIGENTTSPNCIIFSILLSCLLFAAWVVYITWNVFP
jgi:hypothetical protein